MALIKTFESRTMGRNSIHEELEATYSAFETDGRRFIQFDSYGRPTREMTQKSQTFQLDEDSAREMVAIITRHFRF